MTTDATWTAAAARDWALFSDWCVATGRTGADLSTLDLLAFSRDLPCAPSVLASRLRAAVIGLGWAAAETGHRTDAPAWRGPRAWVPLGEALRRCETTSWPVGFRGRRDAFLLTLAAPVEDGGLGLSRSQMQALGTDAFRAEAHQIGVEVGGQAVAFGVDEDPNQCPTCTVIRWLDVASLAHQWGEKAVRERLVMARPPHEHLCADPANALPPRWREVWFLLPAIDRHGWTTTWRPMSLRSITSVLTERCDRLAPFLESTKRAEAEQALLDERAATHDPAHDLEDGANGSASEATDRYAWMDDEPEGHAARTGEALEDLDFEEFDARLEAVGADADEINARIRAILDETDAMVAGIGRSA